ncbi:hypothetical protein [Breznakiella homolactica]|uniref:Uncharacterized protein n=1 Tax=Breznakiella homolactica TaxID=2798577 RepID=A0A7T7XMF1_9SPIR|nr:hypothetical protein [Breznakiella homolactica]QQO09045.1 hypothetical protein JFL75_19270 [Breznakiella homolactica]
MAKLNVSELAVLLTDRFSDVWKLLSETTFFLSRTAEFGFYEDELRSWRSELQGASKNPEVAQKVRTEIIALRKNLRLQGYDLSLGRQNLIFDGFRNDASVNEGFKRMVLFLGDGTAFWISGDENHITLAGYLEQQLEIRYSRRDPLRLREKHYLWFLRRGNDLIISGSDTETKEDYERLKAIGEANSLLFLSKLKKLR